jgi:hypothetical protein
MNEPPKVELRLWHTTACSSATELAVAFGSAVFEPAWWPDDIGAISFEVMEHPRFGLEYQIGSARHDGRPIVVIARREQDGDPLGPLRGIFGLDWRSLPELESYQCFISNEDDGVRAALMRDGQTLQLIGYRSEDEILRAIHSLRLVAAGG